MAERRMFAKSIIDSDAFLDMPVSARLLYYDLGMRADDDGFVNSPKKIMKMSGASTDDMNILIARKFVLSFESGIIVIKHWRIHNYIRNDRYKETNYIEEKSMLRIDKNKAYTFNDKCVGIPNGYQMDTESSLGEVSLGEVSLGKVSLSDETDAKNKELNIFDIYQNEIGTLTPRQYEKINEMLKKINSKLIIEAIYISSDNGAKSFKYFETIITDWINKGYKNIGDIPNKSIRGRTIVPTPAWLCKEIEKEDSLITDEDRQEYGIN